MPEAGKQEGMKPGFSLVIVLMISQLVFASGPKDDGEIYPHIAVTTDAVNIDGVLSEHMWESAYIIDLKYETSPGENVEPPVKTQVLIAHSVGYLYIGFRAWDPEPEAIRARLSDRDNLWGDDTVSIMLDTFNDELRAFQFQCNPLGIQRDALHNDAGRRGRGGGDSSWDAIWDSAGSITDWGYSVEMAIPFNALSFPRSNGEQVWGVIAQREYPRNKNHSIRNVPIDRSRNCTICQAAKVVGFDGISPGRNIEITPTFTAVRSEEREDFPLGEMVSEDSTAEMGLTTSWGFTPNFQLDAAFNPDFSQIEADAFQLDVNRTFTLRYDEKRPFFLEGRDFFHTPINAVYTRAISDPDWGFKVTGKEGSNALGVYLTRDSVTNLIFPGSQGSSSESLAMESTASVFRYRRDVMNNSTIGVLMTDREGGEYFNRLLGVDGKLRFTSTDSLTFQALGSSTQYSREVAEEEDQPLGTFSDWSHNLHYEHRTRNWNAQFSHSRLGEGFRADLGYIPRVGYQRMAVEGGGTWYGDSDDLITRVHVNGVYFRMDENDGRLLERGFRNSVWISGAMQSSMSLVLVRKRQAYEDISPVINEQIVRGSIRPNSALRLEMRTFHGDAIDYSNVRKGKRLVLSPEVDLKFGRHLRFNVGHDITRMNSGGGRLYLANVTQSRFIYQFNARMFFRAIFQYVDVRRNQDLYEDEVDPLSKKLFSQLLFSYKLNPRTVLFVGYSDTYLGYQDISMTQSDRALFMKLGYAWVL